MKPTVLRPGSGFTLIEVLVSLAIFALAAVVLSVAYLNIIGSYRAIGTQQKGDEDWKWVGAVILAEPDRLIVEAGGQLPLPDGREINWSAIIEPTDVADLFRLTLKAELPGSGSADAWQRDGTMLLFRPTWSDPVERDKLREKTRQRVLAESRS